MLNTELIPIREQLERIEKKLDGSDYEDCDEIWKNYSKKWYRELGEKSF